jgi:hypothetical protein
MTVRHIVTWKIAETDPAQKAEQVERVRSSLESLPAVVNDIRSFQVGVNSLGGDENWDIVLVADYDDEDGLRGYVEHPEHQKVAAYIRSVVSERAGVDFVV